MFLGGSVPPWAGGAEGDGSPPAANCGIRAVRPLRYSGLRQALREKKRKSLRNHEISANGSFYHCPADKGPAKFVIVKPWTSLGIRTNDLPFPNSYWYWVAFYAQG